ncbi:hypothetical protein ACLIYP_05550 [Streptomyces nanhaiensis]|uniref:hypothetical protein n=1 Tax=Streptomyces nanhaiensis TaxID=679319 RepID=UPI00399CA5F4
MAHRRDQRPVTQDDYDAVARLHAEGLGRNEIARRIDRAQRTVSVIAAELGLTFDTTMTEEATRHRVAQLAERRAILAEALQGDAERLTEQLWQPSKVWNFGGKDNKYAERTVPEPPADAKKNLMAAAGMAIDRSLKLVPPDTDRGEDAARGMVGQLLTGLTAIYRDQQEQPNGEGDGDAP